MMPACDHTGTPRHFHSSTTSGSASLMRLRTRASVSPRQSVSSFSLASISREGEAPPFPSVASLVLFFMFLPLSSWLLPLSRREFVAEGAARRTLHDRLRAREADLAAARR